MPGRNDTCPCGSGKKYKNCCVNKSSSFSTGLLILIAVIATIAAIGLLPSLFAGKDESSAAAAIPAASTPRPQPGVAPPGKVWSAEHGHWHDAAPVAPARRQLTAGSSVSIPTSPLQTPGQPAFTPAPQPPGAVPPGKVWSNEHGHWHDLPK
jgi:hypothetical protein